MKIYKSFLIYIAIVFLLLISVKSFAEGENDSLWKINSYERKVNTVGQRILRANEISEMITFRVPPKITSKSQVNAYAEESYATVTVERPLLSIVENDDELAAVLSHEIVHIINRHVSKHSAKEILIRAIILPPCIAADLAMACFGSKYATFTHLGVNLTSGLSSHAQQKYETDADLEGIDLMVKAGYNPIYMESLYQRMMSDGSYLEFFRDHPKGSIRVEAIHRKIATNYPEFLEQKIDADKKLRENNFDQENKEKVENDINQENILPINDKSDDSNTQPPKKKRKRRKKETDDDNLNDVINYYD